jgi:hypothetical protein
VRLPAEVVELLDERANEKGSERSDYLRDLIVQGLGRTGVEDVAEQFVSLDRRLRDVRQDLATMMKAVLVMVVRVNEDAADEWVRENFVSANGEEAEGRP